MAKPSSRFSVKTTGDDSKTVTTSIESFGDEYLLAGDDDPQENMASMSADTISMAPEGIAVYGKDNNCAPWNVSWSGKIVTSRIFKVT